MPPAVRQRRLPVISALPLPSGARSPEYYMGAEIAPRSNYSYRTPRAAAPTTYRTSSDGIPSPSPSSGASFPIVGSGYGSRLGVGYGSWRPPVGGYYDSRQSYNDEYGAGIPSDMGAPTVVYAGGRVRPQTRVIRAQPGNIPLSDSDSEEPRWDVV